MNAVREVTLDSHPALTGAAAPLGLTAPNYATGLHLIPLVWSLERSENER